MWEVDRALAESTRYSQIDEGRWKAEYKGFVTLTAEGDSPTHSERQLSRAMDVLLASLIRGGKGPKALEPGEFLASGMLSDAITVVKNTAKQTAKFKQDSKKLLVGTDGTREEDGPPPERRKPRKRR